MNVQSWSPLGWIDLISLLSKGLSRVFSSTTIQKHQFFGTQPFLRSKHTFLPDYWKNHGFNYKDFAGKRGLRFVNILSRFVTTFLPRSKHLLISWLQLLSTEILEPKKIKYITVSTFPPSVYHEVMGPDAKILVFWMLSLKPAFSLSSFTFMMRLFSSSLLSAIRLITTGYLMLWVFLPAILIPDCASSSPAFLMMYSA